MLLNQSVFLMANQHGLTLANQRLLILIFSSVQASVRPPVCFLELTRCPHFSIRGCLGSFGSSTQSPPVTVKVFPLGSPRFGFALQDVSVIAHLGRCGSSPLLIRLSGQKSTVEGLGCTKGDKRSLYHHSIALTVWKSLPEPSGLPGIGCGHFGKERKNT